MESRFEKAYLSLGSNLGDRKRNLEQAVRSLSDADCLPRMISSCFETEPVGFRNQPWFLNIALELDTRLAPGQLLERCQKIERQQQRIRSFPNAPRTLDVDILLYGKRVIEEENLIIPHPRMAQRRFVLEPLAEIAPDVIHPTLGRSIQLLLQGCPDQSIVRRLTTDH